MGQSLSVAKLTEPVTLPRIWNACQIDSNMPKELKSFNINLLVNDMNKLGANIPTNGSEVDTCKAIQNYLPNASQVCMVGSNANKEKVYDMVRLFNKQYSTNIPLYANGIDDSNGYRPVADLCDDLYSVQRQVYRALDKNTVLVKQKLLDSILQLRAQQKLLDAEFARNYKYLTKGTRLDAINANVKKDLAMQQVVVNEMNSQLAALSKMYEQYQAGLVAFAPYARRTASAMNGVNIVKVTRGGSQVGGSCSANQHEAPSSFANAVYGGGVNLAMAMQNLNDCFKNMNTTYEEYVLHASQGDSELQNWVAQKRNESIIDAKVRGNPFMESLIGQCAIALTEQSKYIINMENIKGYVKEGLDSRCKLNNVFHRAADRQFACSRDSICAWVNGTCQLNDSERSIGHESTARFVQFNPYTIRALMQVSNYFAKPDNSGATLAADFEKLVTGHLFTDLYSQTVQQYTNLAKLMETRSGDAEGVQIHPYLAHIFGDLLAGYAKYLIRKFELKVIDNNQDSLLFEAIKAYVENNSRILNQNFNQNVPTIAQFRDSMTNFMQSSDAMMILGQHDQHIGRYINNEYL